jgi:hypothetical protein
VVELRAVLRSSVDTLVRTDSVASRTVLEWSTVSGSQPLRLVGMVRDFAVQASGDRTWHGLPELTFPVTFAARVAGLGHQPVFETPDPAGCDARSAAVQVLRDAWVAAPSSLTLGTTWSDSSTYTLCRDGVQLQAASTRRYVVDSAAVHDGRLVLRVRRESDVELGGRGVQFGDSIQVTGRSTSEGTLFLSLDGGAITSGLIRSTLTLELRGRRRTQQLVQNGVLEIRAP